MSSGYFVNEEDIREMNRLRKQSWHFTKWFGGLLSDHPEFIGIRHVLDVACGPGEWATEVARKYPRIEVEGFDISESMIEYAQSKAAQDNLENLSFTRQDATQLPWPYPDGSFNLVNMSLVYALTTCKLWPQLINEAYRILAPGGFLRVIQEDANITTNCAPMEQLHQLGALALHRAGKSFYPNKLGVIPRLPVWLMRSEFQNISKRRHIIDISMGTEGYKVAYEDYKVLFGLMRPFFVQWGVATLEEANAVYERFLQEIQYGIPNGEGDFDPFVGSWDFLVIFGQKPH